MLDMGFFRDVGKIIDACPEERQTMLFSATLSSEVDYLAEKYTNNPVEVSVESYVDHTKLEQLYYDVPDSLKFSLLVHLLKEEDAHLVMVFCSTRRNADFVVRNLENQGINAKAIHGGLEQKKRIRTLKEFHENKKLNILVCTDVAARGLDIKGVTHVYNYDIPEVSSDYIHRIGRTARAGEEGKAINILASRDYDKFSNILNRENVAVHEAELPYVKKVEIVTDSKNKRRQNNSTRGRNDIKLYDAVCKRCGKPCKVPFEPTKGKGVSCQDCFIPKDSNSRGRNKSNSRDNSRRNNSRGRNSRNRR
jgi:ATP-dependent RNA helicase DeaD